VIVREPQRLVVLSHKDRSRVAAVRRVQLVSGRVHEAGDGGGAAGHDPGGAGLHVGDEVPALDCGEGLGDGGRRHGLLGLRERLDVQSR